MSHAEILMEDFEHVQPRLPTANTYRPSTFKAAAEFRNILRRTKFIPKIMK